MGEMIVGKHKDGDRTMEDKFCTDNDGKRYYDHSNSCRCSVMIVEWVMMMVVVLKR